MLPSGNGVVLCFVDQLSTAATVADKHWEMAATSLAAKNCAIDFIMLDGYAVITASPLCNSDVLHLTLIAFQDPLILFKAYLNQTAMNSSQRYST
jgi:hypothetical protein